MGLTGGAEDESTSYGDDPRGAARAAAKADDRVFGYSGPGDWLGEAPASAVWTARWTAMFVSWVWVTPVWLLFWALPRRAQRSWASSPRPRITLHGMARISAHGTPSLHRMQASPHGIWGRSAMSSLPAVAAVLTPALSACMCSTPARRWTTCWMSARRWVWTSAFTPTITLRTAGPSST